MSHRSRSLLIIAGEASGDLHASKVVTRLKELAPDIRIFGVGGDRMRTAGMELSYHSSDFAVVGFIEVIRHIPKLKRVMNQLLKMVSRRQTRLALLIDYPGFNLVLARKLRAAGVKVFYYITPQVWAWGERRVRKISERTDRVAVILPFEQQFYAARGVDVDFVGHPLLDEPEITASRVPKTVLPTHPVIGLLPGSRRGEIARHLPPMLGAVRILRQEFGEIDVKLGLAEGMTPEDLNVGGSAASHGVEILAPGSAHDLMADATVLVVSSGTATLESACFGTPMVIVYRTSPLSYAIGRLLVKIPHIGLANVVAGERVVPELVQADLTPERLAASVSAYLKDAELYADTSRRLLEIRGLLGDPGAGDRVARSVLAMMEEA
jgi:lipid-A-disaccharide synthase